MMDVEGRDYVKQHMPLVGLGTYQVRCEKTIHSIVDAALGAGYRFIDTAQIYGNEEYIGKALTELLPKYKLKREDIFITTKLSPSFHGTKKAREAIEESLENLETDYIDLLIIHWPGVCKKPVDYAKNNQMRMESWQVMEEFYKEGALRAIGVSNYEIKHLDELLAHATVLPALNQVEYHPHFHQTELVEYCNQKGIIFQAYSSLGSPDYRDVLFSDMEIKRLAEKYHQSIPLFLLSWATSQGISVLPRSTKPQHVVDNFKATEVKVEQEDIDQLLNNGIHRKVCWDPSTVR